MKKGFREFLKEIVSVVGIALFWPYLTYICIEGRIMPTVP
jgi:hypothetical protein